MFSKPGILLRIEGAFALALSVFLYRSGGAGWGIFFSLFLWPDLSMLGYLVSTTWLYALQPCPYISLSVGTGGRIFKSAQGGTIGVCAYLARPHRI